MFGSLNVLSWVFFLGVGGSLLFVLLLSFIYRNKISKKKQNMLPRATLAEVASWLIQKETHERMTSRMEGKYVWRMKKPILRRKRKLRDNRAYAPLKERKKKERKKNS